MITELERLKDLDEQIAINNKKIEALQWRIGASTIRSIALERYNDLLARMPDEVGPLLHSIFGSMLDRMDARIEEEENGGKEEELPISLNNKTTPHCIRDWAIPAEGLGGLKFPTTLVKAAREGLVEIAVQAIMKNLGVDRDVAVKIVIENALDWAKEEI